MCGTSGGTSALQLRSDRFLCPGLSVFARMKMAGDEVVNRRSAMAAAAGVRRRVCVSVCVRTRTHLPGKIEAPCIVRHINTPYERMHACVSV